ncbi:uncharacterized protein [Venturia canescens]|uniref:uncharacterized protein isoform X1 n=1 Tax=Venturia canescens TaxID=32260 RepID=UPI001C9CD813|nr:uncharacterized protein LOC122416272 isoform X1 [Venturia canescens]
MISTLSPIGNNTCDSFPAFLLRFTIMENGTSIEIAKDQFVKLMNNLTAKQKENLLSFAVQKYFGGKPGDDESDEGSYCPDDVMDDPVALLNSIAKEIRAKVPMDAVLPSETITAPKKGQNSDCDPKITKHVDAFLYNDDELEDLVKDGKLSRNYCLDCGSTNTKPLIFISHSTSREELYHIFNTLLPPLDGKIVVDVGSRLGAVLYGAYAYTDAKRIIGVEMNKEFCDLQNEIIRKYKMENRLEIINSRIEEAAEVVKSADVLILNNVFEFYLSESEEKEIWKFLHANLKSGSFVVSRPAISETFATLETGIRLDEWLKAEVVPSNNHNSFGIDQNDDENEENSEISCYVVL